MFLTKQEIRGLLAVQDRRALKGIRDFAILSTYIYTGLRRSELTKLNVDDFRHEEGKYWLSVQSKGGNRLNQPLEHEKTIAAIKKYLKFSKHGRDLNAPLFQSITRKNESTGRRLSRDAIEFALKRYAAQAGIKKNVHLHMLRHSFGSMVMAAARNLAVTQRAMRHKSSQSTLIYLHAEDSQVRDALRTLNEKAAG